MRDIKEIKDSADIVDVIGRFVHLRKDGPHFKANCPFHTERTESFIVTPAKNMFKCFGCGKGGDVIDFLYHNGMSFNEAIKFLSDPNNVNAIPYNGEKPIIEHKKTKQYTPISPVPSPLPSPPLESHYKFGKPSKIWTYRNANGEILCFVYRFDTPNGKECWPLTYCKDETGNHEWRWKGLPTPRPIYGLDRLAKNPKATVIIVEGEKAADAGQMLFDKSVVISWIGGSNAAKLTDWTPLIGRKLMFWPDNDKDKKYKTGPQEGQTMEFHDQPGNSAMLDIAEITKSYANIQRWIKNPEDAPCGWDIADADWTNEQAKEYASNNHIDIPWRGKKEKPKETLPPYPPEEDYKEDNSIGFNDHFKFLGYTKESTSQGFHFFTYASKLVVSLTPSQITKSNILQLAPLNYWETYFPGSKGIDMDSVLSYLIETSHKKGIYSDKMIRGRGAWIDNKRIVLHQGDRLFINGKETLLNNYKSKYVYEIGERMGFTSANPLRKEDAYKLVEISKSLNWYRSIDAHLLAGWCVIAPFCGALKWRPHIWLTGGAGTGKSWIIEKIVRRLLGESGLSVQGETTEPGLRQMLNHDALPVIFDEAEGSDRRAQERMQNVLGLARSASTTNGGLISKGTSHGSAKTFLIRSCFFFSSIVVQTNNKADKSRVTTLTLSEDKSKDKKERFEALCKRYDSFFNDEYCSNLRSRTINLLPIILKNAETFTNAAAAFLEDQRTGDQLGIMLAGAFSLTSDSLISFEDATAWIKDKDWSEEKQHESAKDENSLLAFILGQILIIDGEHGKINRTIGELLQVGANVMADNSLTPELARDASSRVGIKLNGNYDIVISNSSQWITNVLRDTAWGKNYHKILLRFNGAMPLESERFKSGLKSRAVLIPYINIF